MEVRAGFEPAHNGFADHGVSHFATAPRRLYYNMPSKLRQANVKVCLCQDLVGKTPIKIVDGNY